MDINKIALTLAHGNAEQAEIKAYYIKNMIHTGTTTAVILTASYLLNVFENALIMILTLTVFRANAGGCHSRSMALCKGMSIIITIVLALLVSVIKISNEALTTWYLLILAFGLYMIHKVAPLDSPQRPIISMKFRRKLKTKAYVFFLILMTSVYIFGVYGYKSMGVAVLFALSMQLFLMTKLGYYVVARVDDVFNAR